MYGGDYIVDVARAVLAQHGRAYENGRYDDPETVNTFRELSEEGMIAQQKADLEAFGVRLIPGSARRRCMRMGA